MKYTLLFFSIIYTTLLHGLDVSVNHATFFDLNKPYAEVYISVVGSTADIEKVDDELFFSKINVLLTIEKDGLVVVADKFNMVGPKTRSFKDFVQQRRYALDNGLYKMTLSFIDLINPSNTTDLISSIKVDYSNTAVKLSDNQLIYSFKEANGKESSIVKNGYIFEPLPFNYLGRGERILKFYSEIYNTDKLEEKQGLFRYYIMDNYSNEIYSVGNKRLSGQDLEVFILKMDISKLKSGNYSLITELRNNKNEIVDTKKNEFQRSNPFVTLDDNSLTEVFLQKQFVETLNEEELIKSIHCLSPILSDIKNETSKEILLTKNILNMKRFLFSHYIEVDPNLPEVAYNNYMRKIKFVEEQFETSYRKGYLTDRGVLFIKHGAPNDKITITDEPVLPYEMWIYYDFPATNQSNVKYLFYNNTLTSNDFVLLHSTERGNVSNNSWFNKLAGSNSSNAFRDPSNNSNLDGSIYEKGGDTGDDDANGSSYRFDGNKAGLMSQYGTRALQYWDEL